MYITIRPHNRTIFSLRELWMYRELFYFLAWRDIKVKYKQTLIGVIWVVLQPLVTMLIFTIVFNKVAKISLGTIPYAVFTFSGLVIWNYFSSSLNAISESFINNKSIITKIYFPRIIIPIATTIVDFLDFFIAFIALLCLSFAFRIAFNPLVFAILLPVIIILFFTVLGVGLILATVNIKFRDVRYILPFFIQLFLFLTPVIYPLSFVSNKYSWVFYINPLTGVLDLFRGILFNAGFSHLNYIFISVVSSLLLFILGLLFFRSFEEKITDII